MNSILEAIDEEWHFHFTHLCTVLFSLYTSRVHCLQLSHLARPNLCPKILWFSPSNLEKMQLYQCLFVSTVSVGRWLRLCPTGGQFMT
jgi:hypothetical protein